MKKGHWEGFFGGCVHLSGVFVGPGVPAEPRGPGHGAQFAYRFGKNVPGKTKMQTIKISRLHLVSKFDLLSSFPLLTILIFVGKPLLLSEA